MRLTGTCSRRFGGGATHTFFALQLFTGSLFFTTFFALQLFTGSLFFTTLAHGQGQPPLPPELQGRQLPARSPISPVAPATNGAAPEWMVWRAFYESLRFYRQQSPRLVDEVLIEGAGLTPAETAAVTSAGQHYLDGLTRIDDDARREIAARFQSPGLSFSPSDLLPTPAQQQGAANAAAPQRANAPPLTPGRTLDGRSIAETLTAEGFVANVEERQRLEFRTHWETLARTIGLAKLVALERIINTEVAPNVHVATQATPVPERQLPARPQIETTPR